MKFYLNPDLILTAIQQKLDADVTLSGGGLLNGSNKIFTRRLPGDYLLPCIVIASPFGFTQRRDASEFVGEVRIYCYTVLASNQQVTTLGNLILTRCAELLSNENIDIDGMSVLSIVNLGIIPTMFDAETDKTKARGILRLEISLGYIS
jgi:hypothetical protein